VHLAYYVQSRANLTASDSLNEALSKLGEQGWRLVAIDEALAT
jgi:hypothetical protein